MIDRRTLSAMALAGLATPLLRSAAEAQSRGHPASPVPQAGRDAVPVVDRLDRVVLVAGDLDRLAQFYAQLGFAVDEARPAPDHAALAQATAARARVMRVGAQVVELVAFDPPGAGYPQPVLSTDPWFQHISLIASDMDAMMAQLRAAGGWTPISRDGAVRLSPGLVQGLGGGGVSVFKFRDPEGHPLEFAAFPAGSASQHWSGTGPGLLGYDHSAVGVTDTTRSIAFYCGELGMTPGMRTLNQGAAQASMDDVTDAVVDIVEILPVVAIPHVELLGYHGAPPHAPLLAGPRDRVATRLVLAVHGVTSPKLTRDPDGHWIQLIAV